ncbi:MAG: methylated-DNA-[protein]-cysteine S-methyltransferase [Solirubrobacteraceae bacterium]|nr:methylated-DNA-[protein]-cysteine S-methyltransferase [Solirubrobacteraceae bacterium]
MTPDELERALARAAPDSDPDAAAAAARRAAERAGAGGEADVAYAIEPSPLGDLLVAMTPRGLVSVYYEDAGERDDLLDRLAGRLSPRVVEAPARIDPVRRELDEYFAGTRTEFEVPLDWSLTDGFTRRVLKATARIPYGGASTYREMAGRAGSERAARAAGNALGANPIPIIVPCHRVLRSGGALGGYGGGVARKRFLLDLEGTLT